MSTLVFLMGVIGGTNFLNSLYSSHNVDSNTTVEVREEYEEYERAVGVGEYQDDPNSLYNRISNPNRYTGIGAVDQAIAGVLVVPKFIGVLTTPIQIVDGVITGLQQSTVGRYIPNFVWSGFRIGFYATLLYSVFSLIIGMRA
ncbi:hypothetical protein [Halopenitus persicus]|uniref:hypothetical protein n=1 Tax=Halopenitus persicus TaxID=1048396 RepID=UPI0012FE7DBC|nr:hypothetical protein [Halopenitus persicus]